MTFSEENNTLICHFSGDMSSMICDDIEPELNGRIEKFLEDRDTVEIVFDLAEVRYISSAFLRLCLYCCKKTGPKNFRVCKPSPDVRDVFKIAGLTEIMNVE